MPLVDTGKRQPYDFLDPEELPPVEWDAVWAQIEPMLSQDCYFMLPYSSLILVSQPEPKAAPRVPRVNK